MAPRKRKIGQKHTPDTSLSIELTGPPTDGNVSSTPSKRVKLDIPSAINEEDTHCARNKSRLRRSICYLEMKKDDLRRRGCSQQDFIDIYDYAKSHGISPRNLDYRPTAWNSVATFIDGVCCVLELNSWLQSGLFKEPFMWLMQHYLIPNQYVLHERGPDFETIRPYLERESLNRELTLPDLDRTEWIESQWMASCVQRVYEKDVNQRGSLFRNCHVDIWRRYEIIYSIIQLLRRDRYPAGRYWLSYKLGFNADEQAALKQWIDAVPRPLEEATAPGDVAPRELGLAVHATD